MALLSVEAALDLVLAEAHPLAAETVPLSAAHGRVLAAPLAALRAQPPADVSAMDGYAVRAADLTGGPVRLTVIGEVPAGTPFGRRVGPGEAARIFTGGVVPAGADTVVVQEVARREGDAVVLDAAATPGKHVRRAGIDFATGETLLAPGRRLTMRDVALAAAMNHASVPVHRRPRVALLATGDELVAPGSALAEGQIVHSNAFALAGMIGSEGGEPIDFGVAPDRLDETIAAIRRVREAQVDILVTTGGASVGDYDLVQPAFAAEGMSPSFWKVAMRPGKPLMHGRIGPMQVLGLPGNPVSSFVTALVFLIPLLRRLQGRPDLSLPREPARAGRDLAANDERVDFVRATLSRDGSGASVATPLPNQDSSLLAPLAAADALLVRPPKAEAVRAGGPCEIIRLPM